MGLVMLVEDDRDLRDTFKTLLEINGFEVLSAENGQDALDQLRSSTTLPDLILLDIMMPVMDGQAFRRIQMGDPRLREIPVVVTSADLNAEEKIQTSPVAAILEKPSGWDQILGVIRRFARSRPPGCRGESG